MAQIDQYLEQALKKSASDLHFVSGDPVRARVHGNLAVLNNEVLKTDTGRTDPLRDHGWHYEAHLR